MTRMWLLLVALCLVSCEDSDALVGDGGDGVGDGTVTLRASSPVLATSSDSSVTLIATVTDENSVAVENTIVDFATADSAVIIVTDGTTDANGQAFATLSHGGDLSNRTITVTASVGDTSDSLTVFVSGTEISITGSSSFSYNSTQTLTLALTDADGVGVPGAPVAISASGSTVSPTTGETDASGQLGLQLTADQSGEVTASALGATTTFSFTVSPDSFTVSVPSPEIEIDTCTPVTATWLDEGIPVVGQSVVFTSTRGGIYTDPACTVAGGTATTGADGTAVVYLSSSSPGMFTVTATSTVEGTGTGEFIATEPHDLTFQAEKTVLAPTESVVLTATVRDPNNNLVKNAQVSFNIKADNTGGNISPATDVTDSLGRAQTVFTASQSTSPQDGIEIGASVDAAGLSQSEFLTVSEDGVSIQFGMSIVAIEQNSAGYAYPGTVIVSDSSGGAVSGAVVTLTIVPTAYEKGYRYWDTTQWVAVSSITLCPTGWDCTVSPAVEMDYSCDNEDMFFDPASAYYLNDKLDVDTDTGLTEDYNGNGTLEPGRPVTIDTSVTTGDGGLGEFFIYYPKDYADWVQVTVTATTSVAGTESRFSRQLRLPAVASDVSTEDKMPPGAKSPYGTASDCSLKD